MSFLSWPVNAEASPNILSKFEQAKRNNTIVPDVHTVFIFKIKYLFSAYLLTNNQFCLLLFYQYIILSRHNNLTFTYNLHMLISISLPKEILVLNWSIQFNFYIPRPTRNLTRLGLNRFVLIRPNDSTASFKTSSRSFVYQYSLGVRLRHVVVVLLPYRVFSTDHYQTCWISQQWQISRFKRDKAKWS